MLTPPRLFTAAAVAATVLLGVASAAPPPLTPALGARALAAAATDDDSGAAGSFFPACDNADGVYAPFCQPAQNSSLYPGTTYYVTWDPSVFDSSNTTVIVEGSYVNTTSDEITAQAFSSPEMEAGRSYYAWTVDGSSLPLEDTDADADADPAALFSIALVIRALVAGSNTTAQVYPGPTVVVVVAGANMTARRAAYRDEAPGVPTGAALYVGLPTVLGFCVLMIFGVCAWNRQARRIGLGNISGRAGGARGARMGRRLTTRRDRKQAIRLAGHDGPEDDEDEDEDEEGGRRRVTGEKGMRYQDGEPPSHPHLSLRYEDDGWGQDLGHQREEEKDECRRKGHDNGIHVGIARRDSDALGSLAGTPTSEHFPLAQEQKKS